MRIAMFLYSCSCNKYNKKVELIVAFALLVCILMCLFIFVGTQTDVAIIHRIIHHYNKLQHLADCCVHWRRWFSFVWEGGGGSIELANRKERASKMVQNLEDSQRCGGCVCSGDVIGK